MTNSTYDAIVIGGGSAGLSAAQALGRSLRRTLVIDSGAPRNRVAHQMHNVLGLDGTPPLELLARGRAEAERYGVEFRANAVTSVRESAITRTPSSTPGALLELELALGDTVRTRSLVLATGVADVLPDLPGLAAGWGESVLLCPYCHGWEVRGTRLGVITTSPTGVHQAKLIRQWSEDVTVFTAGLLDANGVSALDHATERALRARGVRLIAEPVVEVLATGSQVTAVRTADGAEYAIDAVFTAGELRPHDAAVAGLELARADGPLGSFLQVDLMQRTSHPRIWAAGNVVAPAATVPMVMAAGTMAGAAANAALVDEDLLLALEQQSEEC